MVFEIKLKGVDKGCVLVVFFDELFFVGCVLLFVGDDLIDEKGFVVVNVCGGLLIKVGVGEMFVCMWFDLVDVLYE